MRNVKSFYDKRESLNSDPIHIHAGPAAFCLLASCFASQSQCCNDTLTLLSLCIKHNTVGNIQDEKFFQPFIFTLLLANKNKSLRPQNKHALLQVQQEHQEQASQEVLLNGQHLLGLFRRGSERPAGKHVSKAEAAGERGKT